jgi:glyoxalase family protein
VHPGYRSSKVGKQSCLTLDSRLFHAKPIAGLHHVTAIASDPQRNLDFDTEVLGLRFVKRTINFDDPGTYHFYFGDDAGSPGTILTFFPWPHATPYVAGVL